jgi:hypothetical protein
MYKYLFNVAQDQFLANTSPLQSRFRWCVMFLLIVCQTRLTSTWSRTRRFLTVAVSYLARVFRQLH